TRPRRGRRGAGRLVDRRRRALERDPQEPGARSALAPLRARAGAAPPRWHAAHPARRGLLAGRWTMLRRFEVYALRPDAPAAAHEARAQAPQLAVSVFAENTFATRWFDGVSEIPGRRSWTHLWEQGFRSHDDLAAYRDGGSALAQAERDGWAGWLDGIVERAL